MPRLTPSEWAALVNPFGDGIVHMGLFPEALDVSEFTRLLFDNLTPVSARGTATAGGITTLYTCPTGKRAVFAAITFFNNASGATIGATLRVNVGGTSYRGQNTINILNNANTSTTKLLYLNATETLELNLSAAGTINYMTKLYEYDDTSAAKHANLRTWSTGANTIYTCPTGKVATLLDAIQPWVLSQLHITNESGASRTYQPHTVASGGTPGLPNQYGIASTVTNNTSNGQNPLFHTTLAAGDFLDITVDNGAATQFAQIAYVELDA